jgi:hypothetical protein
MQSKKFLYYLINEQGLCYYIENGLVKTSNIPVPLDKTPDGWQSILLKWERNLTYYGINRNVSNKISYVEDGAAIIRYLFYTKNIEELLYLLIQQRKLEIDIANYAFVYRFLYKGAIDLSTFKTVDISEGYKVSCNIAEDDFSKYLKAYEGVTYEIPCRVSTPFIVPVLLDGRVFQSKINFLAPAVLNTFDRQYTMPLNFINEEGDSFYVFTGDQQMEDVTPGSESSYAANSVNYFFESGKPVTITIKGTAKYVSTDPTAIAIKNNIITSLGNLYTIHRDDNVDATTGISPGQTIIKPFNITINLAAGENLFILFYHQNPIDTGDFGNVTAEILDLSISLESILDPTVCYCVRPNDIFRVLVNSMTNNTFITSSGLLEQKKNFVLTCGDAIRGFFDAVIKLSFDDFFSWVNAVCAGGLSYDALKNVQIEARKTYFDNSDPIDLGVVRKAKFSLATDFTYNTLKAGYPNQTYDTINGKQEYNTTSELTSPITRLTKELNLVSNIRADSYGIEGIRRNYKNLDETSAPSDNDTFCLDIEDAPREDGYYHLRRETYTSISGIISPSTAYNIPLSPKMIIRENWDFIRSCYLNFDDQYLKFQTTDKNPLLTRTLFNGITITENADEKIGDDSKGKPYFIPIVMEAEFDSLINLADLLTQNPNRCFKCIYERNGIQIPVEGFNLSVGIAPNDYTPQAMKLLLSTNNNLNLLIEG